MHVISRIERPRPPLREHLRLGPKACSEVFEKSHRSLGIAVARDSSAEASPMMTPRRDPVRAGVALQEFKTSLVHERLPTYKGRPCLRGTCHGRYTRWVRTDYSKAVRGEPQR